MKNIKSMLVVVAFLFSVTLSAQEIKPEFEKQGDLIKGTFYNEDGGVSQEGTYKDGKLHGKWISYDQNGKKVAMANYEEGIKTGKWFFWSADQLTEVDYSNNLIAEVTKYDYKGTLVTRN
ncbi:toxin-antitoxin system YwqK family antitoxin [Gillisia sp. Q332]|uniref:toxin-antitoxin system YwqK family antitoxin n=1 Tax=Gillisia xinjiangensis TaxID=3384765 RepID=UPI00391A12A7